MTILYLYDILKVIWRDYMSNTKQENFKRIATNRVNKIIDLISKLQNLTNSSFYEYTDEQVNQMFKAIQTELDKQKKEFMRDSKKGKKRFEL